MRHRESSGWLWGIFLITLAWEKRVLSPSAEISAMELWQYFVPTKQQKF
jgi:hypothetical protein